MEASMASEVLKHAKPERTEEGALQRSLEVCRKLNDKTLIRRAQQATWGKSRLKAAAIVIKERGLQDVFWGVVKETPDGE